MSVERYANASYTQYTTEIQHSREEGIFANAVAGPDPQHVSLVRLHAAVEIIQVFWTATREGSPPVIPSEKSYLQNYNRVFLGGARAGLISPVFGGHSFSMSGVYVYAVMAPEGLSSAMPLGKCPWETASVADFVIPQENFVNGILNPAMLATTGLPVDPDVSALNVAESFEPVPVLLNPIAAIP